MDKHYTLMIIPEKDKSVRSIKIPGLLFRSFAFITVLLSILAGILIYDYWKVIQQIHENKHLTLENRQLRDQIRLFQMKINSLADDIERINTFERKLRIITGLEDATTLGPIIKGNPSDQMMDDHGSSTHPHGHSHFGPNTTPPQTKQRGEDPRIKKSMPWKLDLFDFKNIEKTSEFKKLRGLYDKKIATGLRLNDRYQITRKWSEIIKKSLELSSEYAHFDFKFKRVKSELNNLEKNIHVLDQHLLDKESILRSTPSILPATGWITSYFGVRISPYSGDRKMHEGLDVGAPFGTPIRAPADGIITFAGNKPGFGNFVKIDHGYGIETIYAHAQKVLAKNGEKVFRGDLIAKVGSTGYSTGPHLHYEVRVNGIAVDPLYFIIEQ